MCPILRSSCAANDREGISLQKDIIDAQTMSRSSSEALDSQKSALASAQTALRLTNEELTSSREQLKEVFAELKAAREEYESPTS